MAPVPGYAGTKTSARGLYSSRQHRPSFQNSVFSIEEILSATNNFSPALKIGQGGFGAVYKGVLPDGTVVAVKRAKLVSRSRDQAACCSLQFSISCRFPLFRFLAESTGE
jgi:hypothetical protein